MTFEEQPISIKEMFGSLKIMLLKRAKEKKLHLTFIHNDAVPDVVLGDLTRLTQIILNFVSNAIKFTKQGSVEVSAKTIKEESDTCCMEFIIKDTGIGIAEDKLQFIFEIEITGCRS